MYGDDGTRKMFHTKLALSMALVFRRAWQGLGLARLRQSSGFCGFVMKDQEFVGGSSQGGICAATIVAELDLKDAGGELLDHSANLAADEASGWHILQEGHYI